MLLLVEVSMVYSLSSGLFRGAACPHFDEKTQTENAVVTACFIPQENQGPLTRASPEIVR